MSLEWDAIAYHHVGEPQYRWGLRVLDRLPLRGDEAVLDLGCGTARVTGALLSRLPQGRVFAVDLSANMTRQALETLSAAAAPTPFLVARADALALPFEGSLDAIFSTATFHWVLDPRALYRGLARALKPGGTLEAQCGGGPNVKRLHDRAHARMREPRFARWFEGWVDPWVFLDPDPAAELLRAAGFAEVRTWLEEEPTPFADPAVFRLFIERVVLRHHVARLPDERTRAEYLDGLVEQSARDDPPYLLDYWRLNLSARRSTD